MCSQMLSGVDVSPMHVPSFGDALQQNDMNSLLLLGDRRPYERRRLLSDRDIMTACSSPREGTQQRIPRSDTRQQPRDEGAPTADPQPGSDAVKLRWKEPATQATGGKRIPASKKRARRKAQKVQTQPMPDEAIEEIARPWPSPAPSLTPHSGPLGDAGYWWWYAPDSMSSQFEGAKNQWVRGGWELAQRSDIFQECLVLYAKRKRTQIAGYVPVPDLKNSYLDQKQRLLQSIRAHMQNHGRAIDQVDVLAIASLAYCSLLDCQFDDARTHLRALRTMDASKLLENATLEWLYLVGLDLRFSLFEARPPTMDYFIPRAYREDQFPELQTAPRDELWNLAERSFRLCPHSPDFGEAESFDLFLKFHTLYSQWSQLESASNPPFGHLYDIEYRLRVADARLITANSNVPFNLNGCMEMLVATLQLHDWIIGRFWAPVTLKSRCFLIVRVCRLIQSTTPQELISLWTTNGHISSLLWVLSTIVASAIEAGIDPQEIPLAALQSTVELSGVTDRASLIQELRQWLWLENWHAQKFDWLWDGLQDLDGLHSSPRFMKSRTSSKNFYLGAVEFYNS